MFTIKLANFFKFTVSKENIVKCLEGSADIFGNGRTSSLVLENLRQSSGIVGSRRKSSKTIWNCRKMAKNSLIYSKNEVFSVTKYPHSDPLRRLAAKLRVSDKAKISKGSVCEVSGQMC